MDASASSSPPTAVGSGNVTDTQVAFMVECYLRDCRFTKTLDQFRSEAARVLQPLKSVPKGARTLSAVLNEYVLLKEQHIEFIRERSRVDALFTGLQEIVNVYQSVSSGNVVGRDQLNAITSSLPPASALSQQIVAIAASSSSSSSSCAVEIASKDGHGVSPTSSSAAKRKNNDCSNLEAANNKKARQSPPPLPCSMQSRQSSASPSPLPEKGIPIISDQKSVSADQWNNNIRTSVQPGTPPVSAEQRQTSQLTPSDPNHLQQQHQKITSPPSTSAMVSHSAPSNASAHHFLSPHRPSSSSPSSFLHHLSLAAGTPIDHSEALALPRHDPSPSFSKQKKSNSSNSNRKTHSLSLPDNKEFDSSTSSSAISKPSTALNKKKGGNSKCRLLDFSSASTVAHPVSSSSAVLSTGPLQLHTPSPPSSDPNLPQTAVEASCELTQPQTNLTAEVSLSCDGVLFDDLFDLELDVDLISELEDLQPINDVLGSCSRGQASVSDKEAVDSVESSPFDRRVLSEKGNILSERDISEGQCILLTQDMSGSYSISASPNHCKALRRHNSSTVCMENKWRDKENVPLQPSK